MFEVEGIQKILSVAVKKRFSKPRELGTSQFAFSNYGAEDIYLFFTQYGANTLGDCGYGNILNLSGIYQTYRINGKRQTYRFPFFIKRNPRTDFQQENRQKYADGIVAWKLLTDPEKKVYNEKAFGEHMSGYNLFLKEYLLSH